MADNITKEELIHKLDAFGIIDLADTDRNSDTVIFDDAHFICYDKDVEDERGEPGYGVMYKIKDEEVDEEHVIAVYGKLVEPEGGTVWMYGDPVYYEIPEELKDSPTVCYNDDIDAPGLIDAAESDSELDRDFFDSDDVNSDDSDDVGID